MGVVGIIGIWAGVRRVGVGLWLGVMELGVGGRSSIRWHTWKGDCGRTFGWEVHSGGLGMVMIVMIDTSLGTVGFRVWRVLGIRVWTTLLPHWHDRKHTSIW